MNLRLISHRDILSRDDRVSRPSASINPVSRFEVAGFYDGYRRSDYIALRFSKSPSARSLVRSFRQGRKRLEFPRENNNDERGRNRSNHLLGAAQEVTRNQWDFNKGARRSLTKRHCAPLLSRNAISYSFRIRRCFSSHLLESSSCRSAVEATQRETTDRYARTARIELHFESRTNVIRE